MIDPRIAAPAVARDCEVVTDMLTHLRSQVLEFHLTGGAAARKTRVNPRAARTMDVNAARRRVNAFLSA